jgi:hypothetical protein
VLFKPAQTTDVLLRISSAIGKALPRSSATELETAHAYFERLSTRDWDALAALCSEVVLYLLPGENQARRVVFRFDEQGLIRRIQVGTNTERLIRKQPSLQTTASKRD